MKTVVVIPARLSSSRLSKKVLLDLKGKSVIQRVYEQVNKAKKIKDIYIATDSEEVRGECKKFTDNIIMTSKEHQSGTDRIAEAVKEIDCDVVINVQGDEPFIKPELIDELAKVMENDGIKMASVMHRIANVEELLNPNVVKVIINKKNEAIYFSRSAIPYIRDERDILLDYHKKIPENLKFYRHLGIYAYSKEFLLKYSQMEMTYLEKLEKLEQLRVIESGYKIKMIETDYSSIGIDTKEDYEKALEILEKGYN